MPTAVQAHGFAWEKEILEKVFGLTNADIPYTAKMDIPVELNTLTNVNISIKATKNKNIVCMADCLRVYDAVSNGETIHMIVVIYKQSGVFKEIVQIIEINLHASVEELFGTVTRAEIVALRDMVLAVPQKRSPTTAERTAMRALKQTLDAKSKNIQFNIKCSASQSRLQCSFNKFQKFLTDYPERIMTVSDKNIFYNKDITVRLHSPPRNHH